MSIRDRVISVLKEFPETRNDDNRLYLKVLEDMGVVEKRSKAGPTNNASTTFPRELIGGKTVREAKEKTLKVFDEEIARLEKSSDPLDMNSEYVISDVSKMPSFESVRRRRQEIQNDEKRFIPTDPDVIAKRRMFSLMCPGEILSEENRPPKSSELCAIGAQNCEPRTATGSAAFQRVWGLCDEVREAYD